MKQFRPLVFAAALLPAAAQAQVTWNGTTSNNWGIDTNWDPAGVPASGASIVIANTTASSNQLLLDANRAIGNLQFGTTGERIAGFSIRSTSAHTLGLTGGLTATGAFAGVGFTMNGKFSINANQEWNIGGEIGAHNSDRGVFIREIVEADGTVPAGEAAIGSLVLGGNLTKTGSGQLVIAATTVSGAGNFIVNAGAIKFNAGVSRLLTVGGSGNVTVNNDAQLFLSRNSGTMSITRNIILNNTAGMVWGGGTTNVTTVDSAIAWNGTHTLNLANNNNQYTSTGAWTGSATVNRTGTSTLTVSGDLSGFTGTLNLQTGTNNLTGTGPFGGNLGVAAGTTTSTKDVVGSATVTGGTLQFGDGGTAGGILGDIANNGTVILNRSDSISYGGAVSGTGAFTKQGAGTLEVTGASTYTGATTISGGTISIAGADNRVSAASAVSLGNAAGVTLDLNGLNQEIRSLAGGGATGGIVTNSGTGTSILTIRPAGTDNITFSGVIGGAIRLEVVGTKTAPSFTAPRQRLANIANTFTGGILVDGGTLMVRQDGSLGAVPAAFDPAHITLRNNGTLFNEATVNLLTIHPNRGITLGPGGGGLGAGFISGSDSMANPVTVQSVISGAAGNHLTVLANNGTLIFTGENTYGGDTKVQPFATPNNEGRLMIGDGGTSGRLGTGNVVNDGRLTFNRSDTHTYPGAISGIGRLTQAGAGTTTLTGALTYSGPTTVSAGTLAGTGSAVSATTVENGGNLAPGAGIGTMATAALTFQPGAALKWEMNSSTATADRVVASGNVTIGAEVTIGANVGLVAVDLAGSPVALPLGTKFAVIQYTGFDLTGTFDGLPGGATLKAGPNTFSIAYADTSDGVNSGEFVTLTVVEGTPPSGYADWSGGAPFGGDANNDGVPNGLAFLLGAADPSVNALGLLPAATRSGGGLVLTFTMRNAASRGNASLAVEHSSDLGNADAWTAVPVPDTSGGPVNGVTFTIIPGNPLNTVTATIATTEGLNGKLFARGIANEN